MTRPSQALRNGPRKESKIPVLSKAKSLESSTTGRQLVCGVKGREPAGIDTAFL
ncbi:hypothetical protein DEO72_LG2g3858 [Vigna unguiculata]|uniref:Uncharacterized protein n=1 Tax=Vigna unguiculata TaxID=3917 RepID=A0A4D6L4S3_VIGUN|nr:hypothetical protein DEO72_LG2g3858 [Vigna unguiculata]